MPYLLCKVYQPLWLLYVNYCYDPLNIHPSPESYYCYDLPAAAAAAALCLCLEHLLLPHASLAATAATATTAYATMIVYIPELYCYLLILRLRLAVYYPLLPYTYYPL